MVKIVRYKGYDVSVESCRTGGYLLSTMYKGEYRKLRVPYCDSIKEAKDLFINYLKGLS